MFLIIVEDISSKGKYKKLQSDRNESKHSHWKSLWTNWSWLRFGLNQLTDDVAVWCILHFLGTLFEEKMHQFFWNLKTFS